MALSNPDYERVVLPALHDAGDTEVVARCLDAVELAACLAAGGVDANPDWHQRHALNK